MSKAITPKGADYAQWYLDVIDAADLAEHSLVKGCMIIKPYGYAIWEQMQKVLDDRIKQSGHQNAYFPLFIPKSLLEKEAEHVEGFAKESAVVTHYRLRATKDKKGIEVDPDAKLEEELIIRPTSETIIYSAFSKWIQSWRDLPLKINQWANIVRWEMRTRLFLRTTEFLWQEGHTAHATEGEAEREARDMLAMYQNFAQEYLALPVIPGQKTEAEKFAGALRTYTVEAMMQDGKALQAGTSHHLGQNFAKAFDVSFLNKQGEKQFAWQTSWGVSTRLIGGLIMAHSDDKGLVLPSAIAPIQVVIIPIWKDDTTKDDMIAHAQKIAGMCAVRVHIDDRDYLTVGEKFYEWEKKGVPVRLEIGAREKESENVSVCRRDTGEKQVLAERDLSSRIPDILNEIQGFLFSRAQEFLHSHSHKITDYEAFKKALDERSGFFYTHWCGSSECEKKVTQETKATIRCIPFDQKKEKGACMVCGADSDTIVIFAKAY
ncbi:MAG: prolyl-tRNA synthetase [Parcubacteria group bacterium GW2011_GWC1_41_7]|nr:MAG: prolyl-tRNA synthetase [Parcubacteria group bacterium GW2011_GWC1_41_7]